MLRGKMRRRALLDNNLAPTDKIIYLAMLEEFGNDLVDDLRKIQKYLQLEEGGVLKQLSNDRLAEAFSTLTNEGYIDGNGNLVKYEDSTVDINAAELLKYISDSRIVRGYSKRQLTSKTYISVIKERLRDGHSLEECKAVINYRFESDWHKKNPRYLVPTNIFNLTPFIDALSNIEDVKELSSQVITEYGIDQVHGDESILEVM